jgi:hypothetical protein
MKTYRVTLALPSSGPDRVRPFSPEHFDAAPVVLASLTARLAGGVTAPTIGTEERWGVEATVTVEVSTADERTFRRNVAAALRDYGQQAAYVTHDGARPALYWQVQAQDLPTFPDGVRIEFL